MTAAASAAGNRDVQFRLAVAEGLLSALDTPRGSQAAREFLATLDSDEDVGSFTHEEVRGELAALVEAARRPIEEEAVEEATYVNNADAGGVVGTRTDYGGINPALASGRARYPGTVPPNLRTATGFDACESCVFFSGSQCLLYGIGRNGRTPNITDPGGYPVRATDLCDSHSTLTPPADQHLEAPRGLTEAQRELAEVKSSALPSLDRSPKENWVDKAGGLPSYIDRIARHLHSERGMTISHAIASAVNVVKRWCEGGTVTGRGKPEGGGGVTAKTRAQACKAVAEWEAKKAKTHAKSVAEAKWETPPETFALVEAVYESWQPDDEFERLLAEVEEVYRPLVPSDNFLRKLESELAAQYGRRWESKIAEEDEVDEIEEAVLTAKARKKLPKSAFALPDEEAYPIHDEAHAKNALARVAQHGTPEQKKKVRAAVKRRHPSIEVSEQDERVARLASRFNEILGLE